MFREHTHVSATKGPFMSSHSISERLILRRLLHSGFQITSTSKRISPSTTQPRQWVVYRPPRLLTMSFPSNHHPNLLGGVPANTPLGAHLSSPANSRSSARTSGPVSTSDPRTRRRREDWEDDGVCSAKRGGTETFTWTLGNKRI